MINYKIIACSYLPFSLTSFRELLAVSEYLDVEELILKYGFEQVWNASLQFMQRSVLQIILGNEEVSVVSYNQKFFSFFNDMASRTPVGTVDLLVKALVRIETRQELEQKEDQNSINRRLLCKKLIKMLQGYLSPEELIRIEKRNLLNWLSRNDAFKNFPGHSTQETIIVYKIAQAWDAIFKGAKPQNMKELMASFKYDIASLSSETRTYLAFYMLSLGYAYMANYKQIKELFGELFNSLTTDDKARVVLKILQADKNSEKSSIYGKETGKNVGKKFSLLLDDLRIREDRGFFLILFSMFSVGNKHQNIALNAYMNEDRINSELHRLSLTEFIKRLDLLKPDSIEIKGIDSYDLGLLNLSKRDAEIRGKVSYGLGLAKSAGWLAAYSSFTPEVLSRFSRENLKLVLNLAMAISISDSRELAEIIQSILDSVEGVSQIYQKDALIHAFKMYQHGIDSFTFLELIRANPLIYSQEYNQIICHEVPIEIALDFSLKENQPFDILYARLLGVLINIENPIPPQIVGEFCKFIYNSGGKLEDITENNLTSYLSMINSLSSSDCSEEDVTLPIGKKEAQALPKDTSDMLAKLTSALMKSEQIPIEQALGLLKTSKILNEESRECRLCKISINSRLFEAGMKFEELDHISYSTIDKYILVFGPLSINLLVAECRSLADIKKVIDIVSKGVDEFVNDVRKKIALAQHGGFHEAGEAAHPALNAAIMRQTQGLREEVMKVVGILLANGLKVSDIFGDQQNGVLFRLSLNATNVRVDSSKEYTQLCVAWLNNPYLRHNQHATIQLQRLATTNLAPSLLIKLREIVGQNGKNDPRKIVEIAAMITSFYALKKQDKDKHQLQMEALLEDIDITSLHRLRHQDKKDACEVFHKALEGELLDMLNVWREQLIDIFSKEYGIPKEVFLESKLDNEELQEALMYFSMLGSNKKIRTENKLMFKYMVIVELLGKTVEVKSGKSQTEVLAKYFSKDEASKIAQLKTKSFPFMDNPVAVDVWLAEGKKSVLVNQTMVSPSQEIDNILHTVEAALDHLSDDFKRQRRTHEEKKDTTEYNAQLAGFGRDLSRAIAAGSTERATKICPQIPILLVGKDLQETYNRVVARQRLVSLYKSLDELLLAREGFYAFLGDVDRIMDGVEEHKNLLELIGYKMNYSPGIFMWTGELQMLRKSLEKPETVALIKQHGLQQEVVELQALIHEFDGVRKRMHRSIDSFKNQIEKTIKQLEEKKEIEAVNQLGNVLTIIESSKHATSQVYNIMDLTLFYKILKILKEDNNCLSPTSSINPHTNLSFLDFNRKILAVTDESGRLVSNMLLTLGYFNNIPCLVMDNIYSKNNPAQYYPAIISYLMEKLEQIGMPIVVTDKVRGSKEIGMGIDVTDAEIILPNPVHGPGYHESNGQYAVYPNELVYSGDCIVFYPDFNLRVKKKGNILRKIQRHAFHDIFRGVVSQAQLVRMHIDKVDEHSFDLSVTDDIKGIGQTAIKVNLDEVHREDGKVALQIGLEIKRNDGNKEGHNSGITHPGQSQKGGNLKVILQVFKNIQKFAQDHGFNMLMSDPEFYHTYVLLRRAGFQFDPQAELTPYYERLLEEIEGLFKQNGIKNIRDRSESIQDGQVFVGDEVFRWPDEAHRIFMIYPLTPQPADVAVANHNDLIGLIGPEVPIGELVGGIFVEGLGEED